MARRNTVLVPSAARATSVHRYAQSGDRIRSWVTAACLTMSFVVCLPVGVVSAAYEFELVEHGLTSASAALRGMNDAGTMVGHSLFALKERGVVLSGASRTVFDAPGAVSTRACDINNVGQIVGDADREGFITQDLVNFTRLVFPGATATSPSGINDHGHIVGTYNMNPPPNLLDYRGFLYVDGTWATIDFPGSVSTAPQKINNDGVIVGTYHDSAYRRSAFVRDKFGGWTTIEIPGAEFVDALGIDDAGRIVGSYGQFQGGQDRVHGFVKHGSIVTTVDYPGQTLTDLIDINNAGHILGEIRGPGYTQTAGFFIARPKPTVTVTSNAGTFDPNDVLEIDVVVENPGTAIAVDVYFGVILPSTAGPGLGCPGGDAVAFITPGSAQVTCLSAPLQTFQPFAANTTLPGALPSTTVSDFFKFTWGTTEPAGAYTFFLALTPVGALADGQIGPSDVLAAGAQAVTFDPEP